MDAYQFWRELRDDFKFLLSQRTVTATWWEKSWNGQGDHYRLNCGDQSVLTRFKTLAERGEIRTGQPCDGRLWARWLDRIRERGVYCTTGSNTSTFDGSQEVVWITRVREASVDLCFHLENMELLGSFRTCLEVTPARAYRTEQKSKLNEESAEEDGAPPTGISEDDAKENRKLVDSAIETLMGTPGFAAARVAMYNLTEPLVVEFDKSLPLPAKVMELFDARAGSFINLVSDPQTRDAFITVLCDIHFPEAHSLLFGGPNWEYARRFGGLAVTNISGEARERLCQLDARRRWWVNEAYARCVVPASHQERAQRKKTPLPNQADAARERKSFLKPHLLTRTVSAIALAAGLASSSLYRWLSAKYDLSPGSREKLAKTLKLKPEDIPN